MTFADMHNDYLDPHLEEEEDPIVDSVRDKMLARSEAGIRKYGTTMTRGDLNILDWLNHAQEEAMDLAIYLERLIWDAQEIIEAGDEGVSEEAAFYEMLNRGYAKDRA
jgi:hypothetical protein